MSGVTSGRSRPESQATMRWSSACIGGDSSEVSRLRAVTTKKATLKPYLAEIRDWVAQGMTDVWIAHTLNSTPASISAFRSQHGILRRDVAGEVYGGRRAAAGDPAEADEPEPEVKPRRRSRRRTQEGRRASRPRRRRQRPSRPRATARPAPSGAGAAGAGEASGCRLEAVLDTGDEGYGFWLDGAVRDDPVFAEHWALAARDRGQDRGRPDRDPPGRAGARPGSVAVAVVLRAAGEAGEGGVLDDGEVVRPDVLGGAAGRRRGTRRRCVVVLAQPAPPGCTSGPCGGSARPRSRRPRAR